MQNRSIENPGNWDAIIIGAGHNGLVTSAYLAKAGLRVLVVEKQKKVGGAALTEEFHPGFRNSVASYAVSLLSPKVISDLGLSAHGLKIVERPVANYWPIDSEQDVLLPYGRTERHRAIAALSEHDAGQLDAFDAMLGTAADILRDLTLQTPPRLAGGLPLGDVPKLLGLSRKYLKLDLENKRNVVDLFTKSAAEVLDRWFENEHVKAVFAFDSIVGAYASPNTPGTAYVLLHHVFGEVNGKTGVWGHAIGGMGSITQAMAESATAAGAIIKTNCGVANIETENGKVRGVTLENGEMAFSDTIAVGLGPKLLFSKLLADADIDPHLRSRFSNIRSGSGTFRMNLALSELPDFISRPGIKAADHHGAGIIIGPTMAYLDHAFLDARRDGWSREPVIEMLIPSTIDSTLAPKGQHVASLFVQHVAPQLPDGRSWEDPAEKEAFADQVIATFAKYAPNLTQAVIARQVLSPLDLEQRFGLVDGDIFHGQLGLDQLFSCRPVLGHGNYRMPLRGLYLCGSGAHPGGGVTGAPGHNAAREILKDRRTHWRRPTR
ncbi:MAG: NAD(P)/FAD-dependent oxidoreductase [Pseudomonadota bacterium]